MVEASAARPSRHAAVERVVDGADGAEVQNALQIECTPHGDFSIMEWHYCFQYVNHGRPRSCTAPQIIYVVKPMQEQCARAAALLRPFCVCFIVCEALSQ